MWEKSFFFFVIFGVEIAKLRNCGVRYFSVVKSFEVSRRQVSFSYDTVNDMIYREALQQ